MFHDILMQVQSDSLLCSTEYKTKGSNDGTPVTYRAHPNFYGEQWYDFVLIKWSGEASPLPARIHTFVNLNGIIPPNCTINIHITSSQSKMGPAKYAIVESFVRFQNDEDYSNTIVGRFKRDKFGDRRRKLYLADFESFVEPIVGIPNVVSLSSPNHSTTAHTARENVRSKKRRRGQHHPLVNTDDDNQYHIFMVRGREKWSDCWNSVILDKDNDGDEDTTTDK